jgi:hypothetical protein
VCVCVIFIVVNTQRCYYIFLRFLPVCTKPQLWKQYENIAVMLLDAIRFPVSKIVFFREWVLCRNIPVLLFCNVVATVYCNVDKGSCRILRDRNPGKFFSLWVYLKMACQVHRSRGWVLERGEFWRQRTQRAWRHYRSISKDGWKRPPKRHLNSLQ